MKEIRRLFIASIFFVVLLAVLPVSSVFAYSGGLFDSKLVTHSQNGSSTTTDKVTDDDLATYETLRVSAGANPDFLLLKVDSNLDRLNLTSYKIKAASNASLKLSVWGSGGVVLKEITAPVVDGTLQPLDVTGAVQVGLWNQSTTSTVNVNEIDVYGETVDNTPPSAPTGLTGTSTENAISLSWTLSDTATSYNLYRDSVLLQSGLTSTTYVDSGLTSGESHNYYVTAIDANGNESDSSIPFSISTASPPPPPPAEFSVNFVPNMDSIVIQVQGGTAPYTVSWNTYSETFSATKYTIEGLTESTDYLVTVSDSDGHVTSKTVNTGNMKSFNPVVMPDPVSIFQKMIDSFGDAGTIAIALIGGAVGLGILVVLGLWGWRLSKKWLAASK